MQKIFNLLRSPYDPTPRFIPHRRTDRQWKRQVLIDKIVDFFDPLSVRNLSNVQEFKARFPQIKPLKDWFNLNDDSA